MEKPTSTYTNITIIIIIKKNKQIKKTLKYNSVPKVVGGFTISAAEECSHYTTVVPRTVEIWYNFKMLSFCFQVYQRPTFLYKTLQHPKSMKFMLFDLGRSGNGQIKNICSITTTNSGQNKHNK
jgi:hypothetical protein